MHSKPTVEPTLDTLQRLYSSGLSLRQVGKLVDLDESTIRAHLGKVRHYHQLVTRSLKTRITLAQSDRQRKLALAILRRERPAIYERLTRLRPPRACPNCRSSSISVKSWAEPPTWTCSECEASGVVHRKVKPLGREWWPKWYRK